MRLAFRLRLLVLGLLLAELLGGVAFLAGFAVALAAFSAVAGASLVIAHMQTFFALAFRSFVVTVSSA